MAIRLLPCRYVIFVRMKYKIEPIIPVHLLNSRWLLATARNLEEVDIPAVEPFQEGEVERQTRRVWDRSRKFKEAS